MRIEDLLQGLPTRSSWSSSSQATSREVASVTADSRQTGPGVLFVAIPGTRQNGHRFVEEALARGAVGVVVSEPEAAQGPGLRILVEDPRKALPRLALRLAGNPEQRLRLVGITGTNGKSTTAHLTSQLLERLSGRPVGLLGTLGGQVGEKRLPHSLTTPDPVTLAALLQSMVREGAEAAVMEVSSHALALDRILGLAYEAAVFTNLSSNEHLDFHGDFEAYLQAKLRLFSEYLRGTAVLNLDDPSAPRFLAVSPKKLTFGLHQPGADLRAREVRTSLRGNDFRLSALGKDFQVHLPLPGLVNVSNALGALGVGLALGFPLEGLVEALGALKPVRGRLEPVLAGQPFEVFVDFAHTPAALEQLLAFLRSQTAGRLIALFGCGGDRDRSKRPLMGQVALRHADEIILTSDNPRSEDPEAILDQIAEGLPPASYRREPDRERAIELAIGLARAGDVVVLAGKGHEATQEIEGRLLPFEDRAVALESLNRIQGAP